MKWIRVLRLTPVILAIKTFETPKLNRCLICSSLPVRRDWARLPLGRPNFLPTAIWLTIWYASSNWKPSVGGRARQLTSSGDLQWAAIDFVVVLLPLLFGSGLRRWQMERTILCPVLLSLTNAIRKGRLAKFTWAVRTANIDLTSIISLVYSWILPYKILYDVLFWGRKADQFLINLLELIDFRSWLMLPFVSFRASVDEKPGGFGNSTFGVSIMRKIRSIF